MKAQTVYITYGTNKTPVIHNMSFLDAQKMIRENLAFARDNYNLQEFTVILQGSSMCSEPQYFQLHRDGSISSYV